MNFYQPSLEQACHAWGQYLEAVEQAAEQQGVEPDYGLMAREFCQSAPEGVVIGEWLKDGASSGLPQDMSPRDRAHALANLGALYRPPEMVR